jgi:hypothetical protein
MTFSITPHKGTRVKWAKVEGSHVDLCFEFWVSSKHHLETTVQLKPVDNVGAHSAANIIARFENDDREAMLLNHSCC